MVSPSSEHPDGVTRTQRSWKSILWQLAVSCLVVVFVWKQHHDISDAIQVLRRADRAWLVALTLAAIGLHAVISWALASVVRATGVRVPYALAFVTRAERELVAAVMPFGGIASYVVLVQRFGTYGLTASGAGVATLLYSIVGHLSFLLVVIPTVVWLALSNGASAAVWVGLGVVIASLAVVGLLASALMRGMAFPPGIERRLPAAVRDFRDQAGQISVRPRQLLVPLGISLLGDLLGVVNVWLALRAVGESQSIMVAAAAYAVGTLLMLAAPVFQGIGFVEASMTLVLQQLGVPLPHALAATLLYRMVDIWLPVAIGAAGQFRNRPNLARLPALFPALWTGANGLLLLSSALPHPVHVRSGSHHLDRMSYPEPLMMVHAANITHTVTLVGGFLLTLLALRLVKRDHSAWLIALVISATLTVNHLLGPHDHGAALTSGTTVIILVLYRKQFRVQADLPSIRHGLILLGASLVMTYGYVVASLWSADRPVFGSEFSFLRSLRVAADVLIWLDDGGLDPESRMGVWGLHSFHLLLVLSLAISAISLLRPLVWRGSPQASDSARAQAVIAAYGDSSLDRFKYWPDKYQFFPDKATAVVSHGIAQGVALGLGDPTTSRPEEFGQTLVAFKEYCLVHNLIPAFHQVPDTHLEEYRAAGFLPIIIGRDAVIDATAFSLVGKSMKSLRSTHNRAARTGLVVGEHLPPHDDALLKQLRAVSDDWLTLEGRRERTFTLGQFSEAYMQESPILTLQDADGVIQAFINLIPDGVPGEITFDLMRHRVDAPNGAMDMLMIALIERAQLTGAQAVSLGMVPFAGLDAGEHADLINRTVARLAKPLDQFFASESLFAYKDKFDPDWMPRYLVVPSMAALPRVALALVALAEIDQEKRPIWKRLALSHHGKQSGDD